MAIRPASRWSMPITRAPAVREPSRVTVGMSRVMSSIFRVTEMSGTAITRPSTPWSASLARARSIRRASSEAMVAMLTAYPASSAADSTPAVTAERE